MRQNYCGECGVSLIGPAPVNGTGQPASRHQRWCAQWAPAAQAAQRVPACAQCHGRKVLDDRQECPRCDGRGEEPGARGAMADVAMLEGIRRLAVA